MKKIFLVIKAEIKKQQKHDYHSAFVYLSLLIWPILGFLEVYYTYKPFSLTGYMGISDSKELLAFLGTGFMSYTCFWSMVQNAWSMANQERKCIDTKGRQGNVDALCVELIDQEGDDLFQFVVITGT